MTAGNTILLAEDDELDVQLLRRAFRVEGLADSLMVVRDGQEAIDYLSGCGLYADREKYPQAGLLLLDLKMPRVNGFEVLAWRRHQPHLRHLPVIVLSSSHLDTDVQRAMNLGASAYLLKASDLDYLRDVAREVRDQWLAEYLSFVPKSGTPKLPQYPLLGRSY